MEENILSITLQEYINQVKSLQKEIDTLKKKIKETSKPSTDDAQYNKLLQERAKALEAVNTTLGDTGKNVREYKEETKQMVAELTKERNETIGYANSLNGLKAELKDLNNYKGNLDLGSEEYAITAQRIAELNAKLKELEAQQNVFTRNVGNYTNAIIDAANSTTSLQNATNQTTSSLNDANIEFIAFQSALQGIGNVVPSLAKAMQTYTSITKLWGDVTKTSGEEGAKAMNLLNKSLGAIGIIITLCATLFNTLKERIDQSAEQTAKFREIMAKLDPIFKVVNKAINVVVDALLKVIDVVTDAIKPIMILGEVYTNVWKTIFNTISSVVNKVVEFGTTVKETLSSLIPDGVKEAYDDIKNKVSETASSIIDWFGNKIPNSYGKAANRAKEFAKLENDIHKEELKRIKERGESEARQGILREQIATAEGENKKKLLEDLKEEIKAQTNAEIALNKKRIALMKYKQELSPTSEAERKALAELEAETNRLIGEQGKQLAKIEKQIETTNDKISKSTISKSKETTSEVLKEIDDFIKKRDEKYKRIDKDILNKQKLLDAERKYQDEVLNGEKKTYTEISKIRKQRNNDDLLAAYLKFRTREKDLQDDVNKLKQSLQNTKLTAKEKTEIEERYYARQRELEQLRIDFEIESLNFDTEMYKLNNEQKLKDNEEFYNTLKERAEEFSAITSGVTNTNIQTDNAQVDKMNEDLMIIQDSFQETADAIFAHFDKLTEPQKVLFDTMANVGSVITSQIQDFKNLDKQEQTTASKTQVAMKSIGAAFQGAASIVNSYMNAKQQQIQQDLESGKITEEEAKKEFEKTKKVQIAMATVSMLGGIADAVSTAMSLGPILGPIMGSINSAMVLAAGMLQIQQIKATTLEGGGTETPSLPKIETTVGAGNVTPILNEDFDTLLLQATASTQGESSTNADQRVYILESDIEESRKRVEIRESNTTF